MTADYYVYVYRDPRTMAPFYVGKGRGSRDRSHIAAARRGFDSAVARAVSALLADGVQPNVLRYRDHLSSTDALAIERLLIAQLGRTADGGPLVNQTGGGDDPPNHKGRRFPNRKRPAVGPRLGIPWTDQERAAQSKRMMARMADPETKARCRAAKLGRPGRKNTPGQIEAKRARVLGSTNPKGAEAKRGQRNPMYGRRWYHGDGRHSLFVPGTEPAGWVLGKRK